MDTTRAILVAIAKADLIMRWAWGAILGLLFISSIMILVLLHKGGD